MHREPIYITTRSIELIESLLGFIKEIIEKHGNHLQDLEQHFQRVYGADATP